MKMKNVLSKIALAVAVSSMAAFNAGAIIAYDTPGSTPGNQSTGPFNLGMEFTANQNLTVTALGSFDAGQDGWGAGTITVAIYDVSSQTIVGSAVQFFGTGANEGTLADGGSSAYRFQSVTPIELIAGQTYMIVAGGLGTAANPDYNANLTPGNPSLITANTGSGALTYISQGNYFTASGTFGFPTTQGAINPNSPIGRYGAGSFEFAPVPEVGLFGIAGVALLGMVYVGRGMVLRRRLALA